MDNKKVLPNTDPAEMEAWVGLEESLVRRPEEEEVPPLSLRPTTFSEYVGQEAIKSNLLMACAAARRRGEAMDHVLLYGPPGLGKTTLARLIAAELGVGFKSSSGPVLERPGDLAAIVTSLESRDVLFIDEIHRLPRIAEEVLYPAMEDFAVDILIGQGPTARSVRLPLKPFTLVGATTRTALLTSPLRDRFGLVERMDYYSDVELQQIVQRSALMLHLPIEATAAAEIARRARGTPRIANRILRRVRDYAEERAEGRVDLAVAQQALDLLQVDCGGLDRMDRLYLGIIADKFGGGPVGLNTLAAVLGEDAATIEDVIEPFLLRGGLIVRTPRGRELSPAGYRQMGREPGPGVYQGALPFMQKEWGRQDDSA